MGNLPDALLMETYQRALIFNLDNDFINLLRQVKFHAIRNSPYLLQQK
ncbi:sporulation histidine kinase inhibitor Sda [Alkalihalobacterium alkalinitrilicum]|nr:sporulation histidine kinase inhibitor Sda [Alkalihalobacterium alkalinitrilicum]